MPRLTRGFERSGPTALQGKQHPPGIEEESEEGREKGVCERIDWVIIETFTI